jgi:hypothetical protein
VILEHMKTQTFWSSISSLSDEFSSRLLDRNTVFQLAVFKPKGVANSIVIVGGFFENRLRLLFWIETKSLRSFNLSL